MDKNLKRKKKKEKEKDKEKEKEKEKQNADAAGPLGDLELTAHVLIPQYLR